MIFSKEVHCVGCHVINGVLTCGELRYLGRSCSGYKFCHTCWWSPMLKADWALIKRFVHGPADVWLEGVGCDFI